MAARGSPSEYLTGGPLAFIYLIARRRLGSNQVSGWRPASSIRWRHAVTLAAMTAHAVRCVRSLQDGGSYSKSGRSSAAAGRSS
jgi:hypothetical protein